MSLCSQVHRRFFLNSPVATSSFPNRISTTLTTTVTQRHHSLLFVRDMASHKTHHNHAPTLVKDLLKGQVLRTARPEERLDHAFRRMAETFSHHLPVVSAETGELVGVVTDRDIRTAAESPVLNDVEEIAKKLHELEVRQVMSASVVSVNETSPIVDAAKLMRVSKVGCLPVVQHDGKKCVGIVTRTDMLDQLIRLLEPLP